MEPVDTINHIPNIKKVYLKILKKYCDLNNIKLCFIRTPTCDHWDYKTYNGVKYFADKNNIDYLEMNLYQDEIGIDWKKDSKDGIDHLNHFGAVKTTDYYGKYLAKMNILEDHRNDKNYDSWNKSYEIYSKTVNGDGLK